MMDKARYTRVRELFLEAEELPPDQQQTYVQDRCDGDEELEREVLSLLDEHDATSAQLEGERNVDVVASLSDRGQAGGPATGKRSRRHDKATGDAGADRQTDQHATKVWSQRTHASPRASDSSVPAKRRSRSDALPPPNTILWAQQSKQAWRFNSGWLLAAAILPTLLVGWLTYRVVADVVQHTVRSGVTGLADGLRLSTGRFLQDQAELVQSWTRQEQVRDAIVALEKIGRTDDPTAALRSAPEGDTIMTQLRFLSGRDDIKFVVWDGTGNTLASWLPDRADVGNPIVQDQANGLAKVFRGETIIFGPERLLINTEGFVPETDMPVMAPIVPVRNESGRVVAAMLVRGFDMFDAFGKVFGDTALSAGMDVYAINRDGIMVTAAPGAIAASQSRRIAELESEIAGLFRVADPETPVTAANRDTLDRRFHPLTYAAMRVIRGRDGDNIDPYSNYVGDEVVGAWRWLEKWQLGIVVENSTEQAFAATRAVRMGFLSLGGLLAITALTAAALLGRRSAKRQAMLHPLSRYEVFGELGSGGMGVVYKARHRQLGRDAALKVLRGDRRHRHDQLRFDREARLAASLASPHCVKVYDYGSSNDGEAFCVMEYLRGLTLYEVVARSGHQSFGRTLVILRQICDAIGDAHSRGLMHRDLKPQNVMLSHDAAVGDWAVVFDFGLAKPVQAGGDLFNTAETIWSGTPMYMAPERFREPERIDPRSDIYAIGCIAYFLISGHPPFSECDPESMFALILNENPIRMTTHRGEEVPEELVSFVQRCMAKSLDERFQTVREIADAVDKLRVFHTWTGENADMWWQIHGTELLDRIQDPTSQNPASQNPASLDPAGLDPAGQGA